MTVRNAMRAEIGDARAVAAGLRDAARICPPGQPALKSRLLAGAGAIERLCRLLEREQVLSLKVSS